MLSPDTPQITVNIKPNERKIKMSEQKFVIYDKHNGHIVCDIYDRYKIFDSEFEAMKYIRNKNLNKIDFIVERR